MIRITGRTDRPFSAMIEESVKAEAKAVTAGVGAATEGLKLEIRQAIFAVGLGVRLGNAIGSDLYPKGKASLGAAGVVYTRGGGVDKILDAFGEGVVIRKVGGMLAIPTENVPRISRGGRGGSRPMTPQEVERFFNADLHIVPSRGRGTALLVIKAVAAKAVGKYRRATARRLKAGRTADYVPMFVLVPQVRFAKRFDLPSIAARWADRVPDLILQATPD